MRRLRLLLLAALPSTLSGCNLVLLNPAGDVAVQQRDVLIASTVLMLLIILPVMAMTVLFAFRYRQTNKAADYRPDWHHSTALEVAIWSAPLAIVVALGALTWVSTHVLDPYRPLARTSPDHPIAATDKPLRVDVVALDWKWLFIYPDLGVASLNEMAAPLNRQIAFSITSAHVMNSFFVPALAGQIYAMPGMETPLHAVINKPGDYEGFSANYAGAGFSDMRFKFRGLSDANFQTWVATVKAHGTPLDRGVYLALDKPTEREPVRYYSTVAPDLFDAAVNRCVDTKNPCIDATMRLDAAAGHAPAKLPGAAKVMPMPMPMSPAATAPSPTASKD